MASNIVRSKRFEFDTCVNVCDDVSKLACQKPGKVNMQLVCELPEKKKHNCQNLEISLSTHKLLCVCSNKKSRLRLYFRSEKAKNPIEFIETKFAGILDRKLNQNPNTTKWFGSIFRER